MRVALASNPRSAIVAAPTAVLEPFSLFEVGMIEPVTMTRAASAAAGVGAAPMSVDSGGRFWANAFDAIMKGIPTQAARVMHRNPNLQSPILIMGFLLLL